MGLTGGERYMTCAKPMGASNIWSWHSHLLFFCTLYWIEYISLITDSILLSPCLTKAKRCLFKEPWKTNIWSSQIVGITQDLPAPHENPNHFCHAQLHVLTGTGCANLTIYWTEFNLLVGFVSFIYRKPPMGCLMTVNTDMSDFCSLQPESLTLQAMKPPTTPWLACETAIGMKQLQRGLVGGAVLAIVNPPKKHNVTLWCLLKR